MNVIFVHQIMAIITFWWRGNETLSHKCCALLASLIQTGANWTALLSSCIWSGVAQPLCKQFSKKGIHIMCTWRFSFNFHLLVSFAWREPFFSKHKEWLAARKTCQEVTVYTCISKEWGFNFYHLCKWKKDTEESKKYLHLAVFPTA